MSQHDRKHPRDHTSSAPAELKDVELSWDDDPPGSLELELDDDAFDRVTAVPDMPKEAFAKKLMERADIDRASSSSGGRLERPAVRPSNRPTHPGASPELLDPDYDEQTLKVDQPDFEQRARKMHSDSGPLLSFEFTPHTDSDFAPDVSSDPVPPRTEPCAAPTRSLSDGLPPALGAFSREGPAPRAASEPVREPSVPRTRLPTAELVLELDTSLAPQSALELAESAPAVPRDSDAGLEFEVPQTAAAQSLLPGDTEQSSMTDRFAMGDFTGALAIAEGILEREPQHAEALRYAERCRDVLTQMYAARLGPLSQTVTVAVPNDEIRWLSLDHRAGFLLSLIDGSLTLEEILDISGMSRLDALRLMFSLLDERVIALK